MTRITIADDSMFARMLVKAVVAKIFTDGEFIEASSGQEVLNAYQDGNTSDWYLLDVNMGEPNGLETAKQLIELGVDVEKITLITGNKSSELQSQADEITLSYINKAISPADADGFASRLRDFFGE